MELPWRTNDLNFIKLSYLIKNYNIMVLIFNLDIKINNLLWK